MLAISHLRPRARRFAFQQFLSKMPLLVSASLRAGVTACHSLSHRTRFRLAVPALLLASAAIGWAFPGSTTTTLAITAAGNPVSSVAAQTTVKLTASVVAGGSPVTAGLVKFCNAAAAHCTDINLIGTAQLTSAGTASIKLIPGNGSHSYKAVFAGTNSAPTSASAASPLAVTPLTGAPYATTTSITPTGSTGNYTLTATVTGSSATPLTGSVTFPDLTNNGISLGTAPLGSSASALNFSTNDYLEACGLNVGLVVADFNGDGIPDVATSCGASLNYHDNSGLYIQVYLGTGGGKMAAPVQYLVGNDSSASTSTLAEADVNGDGIPDLVYVNDSYNQVTVLLGNGDGTFQTPKNTSVGNQPYSLAVGDFNGDGKVDVAVTSNNDSKVYILLGNGDGTFTVQAKTYPTNGTSLGIVAGDFNNDGKLDLAYSNWGNNSMVILLGNGDGTFNTVTTTLPVGNQSYSIVAADFNGDGNLDLATGNNVDNSVSVFLGNGDGTFTAAPMPTALFDRPTSIAVADFNGDGIPDMAVVNYSYVNAAQNSSTMLIGNGDGTFTFAGYAGINNQSQGWPGSQDNPDIVVAADMNGDGIPDVVMVDGGYNLALTIDTTIPTVTATATLTSVSPAGSGTHNVEASYAGDSNYTASVSSATPLNGAGTATTTTLSLSPSSGVLLGSSVLLTATVTPSGATGSVTFYDNSAAISGAVTPTAGVATYSVTNIAGGPHSFTAVFTATGNYGNSTSAPQSLTVPLVIQPTIQWSSPSPITYGATLSSILNATAMNGSAIVPGTYVYTSTPGSTVTAATVLGAGNYTLNVAFTPTDTVTYKSAAGSVTLKVNQAAPLVAISSYSLTVLTTNPVTLTATLSSSAASKPTGTVTFLNGATPLGAAVTLVSGVATFTTSTLPIGNNSITAAYSGDANFTTASSPALTEVVEDFNLQISTSAGSVTSATVVPGATAAFQLVISPVAPAATFPSAVNLAVTGLPPGAIATLTPSTLPAGSGTTTVALAITTSTNLIGFRDNPFVRGMPFALALLLLPFARRMRCTARRFRRAISLLLLIAVGAIVAAGISGCSAASGFFAQAPKVYSITATGTSGTLSHSTTVTLTIE